MKLKILLLSFLAVFLSVSIASATTITFGDSNNYWLGWGNGSGDDNSDTIGIPNFTGGTATVNENGYLTQLNFNQSITSSGIWWVISPGDLFIDTNSDQVWDYVVDLTDWSVPGPNDIVDGTDPDPGADDYNIYSISLALDSSDYIFSGTDDTGGWVGYNIRDEHPVASTIDWVDPTLYPSSDGQVSFSGWGSSPAPEYTFDFIGDGLALGESFTIAWAPNCANDVIYETMSNPVPEPATMLLFGSGLIGLAALGRKKFRKN